MKFCISLLLLLGLTFSKGTKACSQYPDSLTACTNLEAFQAGNGVRLKASIVKAPYKWTSVDRYTLEHHYKKKKVKWLNIFEWDEKLFISCRLYRETDNYLIELEHLNETYAFIRDVSEATEQNGGAETNRDSLSVGDFIAILFGAPFPGPGKDAPYTVYIWLFGSNSFYPITDPLMKSLLRGYDDLLEEWRAHPTEEKTIEILKRKHAIEPVIG